MTPAAAIILLLMASALMIILDSLPALSSLFLIALVLMLTRRASWRNKGLALLSLAILAWSFTLSQGLFYNYHPRTALVELITPDTPLIGQWLGTLSIYQEGLIYGLKQSLRFCTGLGLGLSLLWSCSTSELVNGIIRLRLPHGLGFMLLVGLNFLPRIFNEFQLIVKSQRLRGFKYSIRHPVRSLIVFLKTARTILRHNLRKAATIADAVQSRAFDPSAKHKTTGPIFTTTDSLLLLGFGGLVGTVLGIKVLFWLYEFGLYFNVDLMPVYSVASRFL